MRLAVICFLLLFANYLAAQDASNATNQNENTIEQELERSLEQMSQRVETLENNQKLMDRLNALEERRLTDKGENLNYWLMFITIALALFGIISGGYNFLLSKRF